MKTAILIIAAGASRRLGQPKQLVNYRNTFLLDYIIDECISSEVGNLFLVLGANRNLIEQKLDASKVEAIFYNKNWSNGMGSSIACGISEIAKLDYQNAIIVLSDQPYFTKILLHNIIIQHKTTQAEIIISQYKEGKGPPTFFSKSLFPALMQLDSDIGAKPIIKKYKKEIVAIHFENGHIDIDTPDDLEELNLIDLILNE